MKPINVFIASADELYGPITTICCEGSIVKKIPWLAFKLSKADWARVLDAKNILAVCFDSVDSNFFANIAFQNSNQILHHFSADKCPTLYHVFLAIETLQTAWEAKAANPKYEVYSEAINNGLQKLKKYYLKFDEKPIYILSLRM
jgi:hypothetical protein